MDKIIQAIADTEIPTLLTVSGVALLFLSLAGRFGGYLEIKPERQKIASIVSGALLIAGISLHVYPLLQNESASAAKPLKKMRK